MDVSSGDGYHPTEFSQLSHGRTVMELRAVSAGAMQRFSTADDMRV